MKNKVNFLALIISLGIFFHQAMANDDAPNELDLENLPSNISQYIPEGYAALNATKGYLDLDSIKDVILVIKKKGEENSSDVDTNPELRPLFILIGQPDTSYKLAAKNNKTVMCVNCGGVMGDPFMGIEIKKCFFSVEHYGGSAWRWITIPTFKYSKTKKKWFLYAFRNESFHVSDPEKMTTELETIKNFGEISFENFDLYEGEGEI